jgi:hypothetical protein
MRKLFILLFLLPFSLFAQTTYQLNYDSIRVNKTTGTGGTSLYGKVYLKNVGLGLVSDSILTVLNGRIRKVPVAGIVPAISFGTFGSTPNAQGGSYSSGTITLQPASASFPGGVTTGTQSIAGAKTFTDLTTFSGSAGHAIVAVATGVSSFGVSASSSGASGRGVYGITTHTSGAGIYGDAGSGGSGVLGANSAGGWGGNFTSVSGPALAATSQSGTGGIFSSTSGDIAQFFGNAVQKVTIANSGALSGTSASFSDTSQFLGNTAASTTLKFIRISNTSGDMSIGVEGSTPTQISVADGGVAYSTVLKTVATTDLILGTNSKAVLTLNGSTQAAKFKSSLAIESGGLLSVARPDNTRPIQISSTNTEALIDSWSATSEPLMLRSNGTTGRVVIHTNGAERVRVSSTGSVQFNSYGAGTLTTDASGNITATSDERMKNISKFYTTGLSALKNIKPITYKWKDETQLDTANFYTGFSAQNIHNNIPEAAGHMANGDLTVQDRPIMATMINAINELNEKIIALEARITSLEAKTQPNN